MRKITLNKKNTIILAVIGAIIAWLLQDELAVKWLSIIFVLLAAVLMIMNLEKTGWLNLVSDAGPILLKAIDPFLSNTDLVKKVTEKVNTALVQLGSSAQIDQKTCFSVIFYAFFAIVLLVVNKKDNTAMGISTSKVDDDYKQQTKTLCGTLKDRLSALNRDEDWNENNYVPIEAQVEVMINGKRKRKHADLLTCLKRDRSFFSWRKILNRLRGKPQKTVFLVLGDPGSGKSVALRKLCIDLLDESAITNKVPVYINLKKWNHEWTIKNLPKRQDLVDFIRDTLKGDNPDSTTDMFLDNYFQDRLDKGQWYFIFDSFDELPCLMGSENNRELVKKISELLHDFLISGNQNGGVIASRYYKSPSENLKADVTLRIREFDDVRIKRMLHIYLQQAYAVTDKLFREREDLVVLCRNPFYLSLLISYIQIWGTQFPESQMELYDKFLRGRLEKHKGILDDTELKEDDVFSAAEKLALLMQESTVYGFECPVKEIYKKLGGKELCDKYLSILEYIRLCRRGGNKDTISFVHRRFQEYLLAKSIRVGKIKIDYTECICSNSGLRDALALYCEVADADKAKEIAQYCWKTVQDNISCKNTLDKSGSMILVNTLYFMVDAFRNRRDALAGFEQAFEAFILDNMNSETHFVIQLAMANSIALFDQAGDNVPKTVLKIFELKNHYLNDAVMHNCRLIKRVNIDVERQFVSYVNAQPTGTFLRRFSNTNFALSKAKGLEYVRFVHFLRFFRLALGIIVVFFIIAGLITELVLNTEEGFILRTKVDIKALIYIMLAVCLTCTVPKEKNLQSILAWIKKVSFYMGVVLCYNFIQETFIEECIFTFVILMAFTHCVDWFYKFSMLSFRGIIDKIRSFISLVFFIAVGFVMALLIGFYTFKNNMKLFFYALGIGLLGFEVCIILYKILQNIILRIVDRIHISHYTIPVRINKKELANNYDKLHTEKYKLRYLNRILENHAWLEGEWPSDWMNCGERIKLENEELERAIAMLEYENMTTDNQSYNTVIW